MRSIRSAFNSFTSTLKVTRSPPFTAQLTLISFVVKKEKKRKEKSRQLFGDHPSSFDHTTDTTHNTKEPMEFWLGPEIPDDLVDRSRSLSLCEIPDFSKNLPSCKMGFSDIKEGFIF